MDDVSTLGLSESSHRHLSTFKDVGLFNELVDGYRFAISLALATGAEADLPVVTNRRTIFNVGTLDPDRQLSKIVLSLGVADDESVYRTLERLAEWGIREMVRVRETEGRLTLDRFFLDDHVDTAPV